MQNRESQTQDLPDKKTLLALQEQAEGMHAQEPAFKRAGWWDMLVIVLVAVLVAVSLNVFFIQVIQVQGTSMIPTFLDRERVLSEKITFRMREPVRGDVVICLYRKGLNDKGQHLLNQAQATGQQTWYDGPDVYVDGEAIDDKYFEHDRVIKRVMGLSGETVSIERGVFYVDGVAVDESGYWNDVIYEDIDPVTVPENAVFVVGDNRNGSWDSRDPYIGSIPMSRVEGRVVCVIWPLTRIGGFAGKVSASG